MFIEKLLGHSKREVTEMSGDNIVSVNNVNCTIEVKDIECEVFGDTKHHVLFYFDLANNDIMTMAVLKVEDIGFFDKLKLKSKGSFQCGEYVGSVTFTGKREAVITYIRENILKAI